jgi:hypothetical protein
MDGGRFDTLTRQLSSRRVAIGGLLAGLLVPLEASARKQGKGRTKNKKRNRAQAQQEPCWRSGACIVSKGSNVSQCDLAGYTAPEGLDCTRCNLSRANLSGADLTGVNFTRANLSGACLVDADFSGATFTNATNLYGAIFCNTTMPDGSVNNSGCTAGTACCSTCTEETCGHGRMCTASGCTCSPAISSFECRARCRFQNMGTVEDCTICMADLPSCGQPDRYPPCNSSADCTADAACARSSVGCGGPGAIGVCVRVCSTG